jgi:hypothetical protein
LNIEFYKLGFELAGKNYYKNINTQNLELIVNDVQYIFENIYKINYDKDFDITDDITYLKKSNKNISDIQSKSTIIPTNSSSIKLLLFVCGVILVVYCLFLSTVKKKKGDLKVEACIISRQFVENQLISPKSADFGFCNESKIIYLGNNRYEVTNHVDASNAFGASLRKTYFVILKFNQGQWEDINNWTLEIIKIE